MRKDFGALLFSLLLVTGAAVAWGSSGQASSRAGAATSRVRWSNFYLPPIRDRANRTAPNFGGGDFAASDIGAPGVVEAMSLTVNETYGAWAGDALTSAAVIDVVTDGGRVLCELSVPCTTAGAVTVSTTCDGGTYSTTDARLFVTEKAGCIIASGAPAWAGTGDVTVNLRE